MQECEDGPLKDHDECQVYMCPHTTVYVSNVWCMFVLILLYMCERWNACEDGALQDEDECQVYCTHTTKCVRILLYVYSYTLILLNVYSYY
jgi:hypothetical protein